MKESLPKLFSVLLILLFVTASASAISWIPPADIEGKFVYSIYDFNNVSATKFCFNNSDDSSCINGSWSSGVGDITSVTTSNGDLIGGGTSGDIDLSVNYTRINQTIYALDNDTTYTAGNGIVLSSNTFSVNAGAGLLQLSDGLATDATNCGAGEYSYWNSTAWLCRSDVDTTYTADESYINLIGTVFTQNETTLNSTVDARTTAGQGLVKTGTQFNHSDTSSQASVVNSYMTFIRSVSLDTFGHITSIVSSAIDQALNTTSSPSFAGLTLTGALGGTSAIFSGAISAITLNTGHGDNELYAMDQDVRTTDSPSFVNLTAELLFGNFTGDYYHNSTNDYYDNLSNQYFYDVNGELHHLNADAETFDEVLANVFITSLTMEVFTNATGSYINITSSEDYFAFYIGSGEQSQAYRFEYGNIALELTPGTNSSPVNNRVLVRLVGGVPTWTVSTSDPSYQHAMAAKVLLGDSGYVYAASLQEDGNNGFAKRTQRTFRKMGLLYESGLDFNSSTTDLGVGSGSFVNGVYDSVVTGPINISNEGFYLILANGSYVQMSSFADITEYADGNSIGTNKMFNVVFGIVPYDGSGHLYAVVQNKGTLGYNTVNDAYADTYNVLNVFPSEEFLKIFFLPVARMIINSLSNEAQILPNGDYAEDYRGGVAGGVRSGGGLSEADPFSVHVDGSTPLTGDWDAGSYNITANGFEGALDWTYLQNYPIACSAGDFVTAVGDTLTCDTPPAGTVTSVAAGNGLDFTTITSSGSVTLGTPGTLTGSTSNAVTTTSHTHEVTTDDSGDCAAGVICGGGHSHSDKLGATASAGGDLSGNYPNPSVVDDSHNHVVGNIDAASSSSWAGQITDESGTGVFAFTISPTFVTPTLGVASATSVTTDIYLPTDSTNHRITDNSTCVIITGDTATLEVC